MTSRVLTGAASDVQISGIRQACHGDTVLMEGTYSIWSGTCYELTATSFLHVVTVLDLLAAADD
jgi:hypothetical protein